MPVLTPPSRLSVEEIRAESAALHAAATADALADPLRLGVHLTEGQVVARPHLRVIADALRAVYTAEVDRLLVICPPQVGKSTLVGVWTPLWWLAQRRTDKVVVASYANSLAITRGRAVRRLILDYGPDLGVALNPAEMAANDWTLITGGGMRTVGVGGGLTGHGADLLVVDDPHKDRLSADSLRQREVVWDWWSSVALSRLAPGAPVVMILTRWHVDDLAGRCLAEDGTEAEGGRWRVVHLPATATKPDDPLGRAPGAPLTHPRLPDDDMAALAAHWADKRRTSIVRDWHALYQGDPQPAEGALLTEAQLRAARDPRPLARPRIAAVAVDPSGGGRDTAGIIGGWLGDDGRLYWAVDRTAVMDVEVWPREVCRLALELDADRIIVETNYGGTMATLVVYSAWADLAREDPRYSRRVQPRIVAVVGRKNKLLRAEPIAQQVMLDRIRIVGKLPDLEQEWATWQPDDPDSPGRIDASVYLAYALLGPPRTGSGQGGTATDLSRAQIEAMTSWRPGHATPTGVRIERPRRQGR